MSAARVVWRLFGSVPTLACVVLLSFAIVRLSPGSPFASERQLAPSVRAALEARYGLDQPLPVQMARYAWGLAHGDLGPSIKYPEYTVAEIIGAALPNTMLLGVCALAVACTLGTALGLIAALWDAQLLGRIARLCIVVLTSLPTFVVAPLFVMALTGPGAALPPAGWGELRHLVLPATALGTVLSGSIARLLAHGLQDTLATDYVRTARAKGIGGLPLVFRHAIWGALVPLVAYMGPAVASVMVGSVAIERIFCVPGLGPFFVDAAQNRDYFLVMGIVLVQATLLLACNFVADLINAWIDPRAQRAALP